MLAAATEIIDALPWTGVMTSPQILDDIELVEISTIIASSIAQDRETSR
jgi:hypothetical protein